MNEKKFDRIPESPKGYVLSTYEIKNINVERKNFADRAFRSRWLLSKAEEEWEKYCSTIIQREIIEESGGITIP